MIHSDYCASFAYMTLPEKLATTSTWCLGPAWESFQIMHPPPKKKHQNHPHRISTDSTCPAMQSLWLDLQVLVAHRRRFIRRIQMNHRSWRTNGRFRFGRWYHFAIYVALVSYWILPSQQNTAREHHGVCICIYIYFFCFFFLSTHIPTRICQRLPDCYNVLPCPPFNRGGFLRK